MELQPAAVTSVPNPGDDGRRWLEGALGQPLQEGQQVFIMVLSPGHEPDEEARHRARAALEQTFRRAEAHAEEHGVSDAEIDAALREAMERVRPGSD